MRSWRVQTWRQTWVWLRYKKVNQFPVAIAKGIHLFSSRTQKLSPYTPIVLGWSRPGRVGSCRIQFKHYIYLSGSSLAKLHCELLDFLAKLERRCLVKRHLLFLEAYYVKVGMGDPGTRSVPDPSKLPLPLCISTPWPSLFRPDDTSGVSTGVGKIRLGTSSFLAAQPINKTARMKMTKTITNVFFIHFASSKIIICENCSNIIE